jgi:hypothetical protein
MNLSKLRNFNRYKQNLMYCDSFVYSYKTKVGVIEGNKLIVNNWWSATTSKHINYAASQLNLEVIKKY